MNTVAELNDSLIGRYLVEKEIGQGGMATVYLARDIKHEREVAIKVLREDLSASLGAGRFLREIKIAAQLQHPHILPLLDSGEAARQLYFVMPYIKGQSLRERLGREGELPVHEAVRLISEVVDALVEAHAHGVVHRDIKPDNVMLSGRHALVTDFGVAKAISEATGRNTVTTLGVAVGTPTYMSPEQAAADPHVDHRSDIYSVGVMLYEMLTGRPPFTGSTPQQVLAAHVTEAPDPVSKRRNATAPALEQVVMRCLSKRPADRFQTAAELHAALEPLATLSTGITPVDTAPVGVPTLKRLAPWLIGGGIAVAIAAVASTVILRAGSRLPCCSGARDQITTTGRSYQPRISPDGKQVAYLERMCVNSASNCPVALLVTDLPVGQAITVDSSADPAHVLWTPDGLSLIYSKPRGVFRVSRGGGPVRRLADSGLIALSPQGDTLAVARAVGQDTVLIRLIDPASGAVGDSVVVPWRDPHPVDMAWSPDGRMLAIANRGITYASIYLITRKGVLTDSVSLPIANPIEWTTGSSGIYVLVPQHGTAALLARVRTNRAGTRFDGAIDTLMYVFSGSFDVSPATHLAAFTNNLRTDSIWTIETNGSTPKAQLLRASTGGQSFARLSPDGRTVSFIMDDHAGENVYTMPFEGGAPVALTTGAFRYQVFYWYPDGRQGLGIRESQVPVPVNIDYPSGRITPLGAGKAIAAATFGAMTDSASVWSLQRGRVARLSRDGTRADTTTVPTSWSLHHVAHATDALLSMYVPAPTFMAFLRVAPQGDTTRASFLVDSTIRGAHLLHWHGDTLWWSRRYAPAGAVYGFPIVWRSDGHHVVRLLDLPAECGATSVDMSMDGRRFTCERTNYHPDVMLLRGFNAP